MTSSDIGILVIIGLMLAGGAYFLLFWTPPEYRTKRISNKERYRH